jgi:hypothetical protein
MIELGRGWKGSGGRGERSAMTWRHNSCSTTNANVDKERESDKEILLMQKKIWKYAQEHHHPVGLSHGTLYLSDLIDTATP